MSVSELQHDDSKDSVREQVTESTDKLILSKERVGD